MSVIYKNWPVAIYRDRHSFNGCMSVQRRYKDICPTSYWAQFRSGPNLYIRRAFGSCWRMRGVCKSKCTTKEKYYIFCNSGSVCCITEKDMPGLVG
ncbi:beta-defensin 135 [Fukomys damarensis]|uniref:beta-defensin 135 n=1 Tax=Fukomys damarensis TaxID=885580 RepID=UPI00053FD7F1|nr:beta-defensin 135 [Fukomys damarensis]